MNFNVQPFNMEPNRQIEGVIKCMDVCVYEHVMECNYF